jgi:hypothetical protein
MDARNDSRIAQSGIGLACLPEPEIQAEAVEFLAHICNETGRREIEDPKTGISGEQFLNEQAGFDGFAKAHFVRNHYASQMFVVEDVTNETNLMGKCDDFAGVKPSLRILTNQVVCEQPSEAAFRLGRPSVTFRQIGDQFCWSGQGTNTGGIHAWFDRWR